MNIKTDVIPKLNELVEQLAPNMPDCVDAVVLFGSYARNEQSLYSDLDIAIVRNTANPTRMLEELHVEQTLQDNLTPLEVNVFYTQASKVTMADSPWDTNYNIRTEGKVLWQSTATSH